MEALLPEINQRLSSLIDHFANGSRKKFAETIGVSPQVINRNFNLDPRSDEPRYPIVSTSVIDKIIGNLKDLNTAWLLTGEGTMLKSDKPKYNEVSPVPVENYMMVEYADLRASAGKLGGSDVSQLPDTHKRLVPKEFESGDFLVVRVDGDSMDDGTKRSLSDGDEILIKEKHDCNINELPIKKTLFVITTREGNVLKQIAEVDMEQKHIVCRSFNPDPRFEDFTIKFEDIYQIFIVCKRTQSQISLI